MSTISSRWDLKLAHMLDGLVQQHLPAIDMEAFCFKGIRDIHTCYRPEQLIVLAGLNCDGHEHPV